MARERKRMDEDRATRLRRRALRMMIPSVIALPVLFVLFAFSALGEGFCGDRISSEIAACEANWRRRGMQLKVLAIGFAVVLLVGAAIGLYVAWTSQPPSGEGASEDASMANTPPNIRARVVLLLGLLSGVLAFVGRGIGGLAGLFVAVPSLILGPIALLNWWRARRELHERGGTPGDNLYNRLGATAAGIAMVVSLAAIF